MQGGGAGGDLSREELAEMLLRALQSMDLDELRRLAGMAVTPVRGDGAGPAGRRYVLPVPHAAAARPRRPVGPA